MRIKELLQEAPIPDSWDKDIFNDRVPFKTRVEYAKARAVQVGKGSARVAFEIPYKGRKTVLKIALSSAKGLGQNQEEAELLSDGYISRIGNVIPLIDYDEVNSRPTWIHTEYATKITQKQLERYFDGIPMYEIISYLDHTNGRNRGYRGELPTSIFENENFQMLQDLVTSFNMPAGDFARKANWGLYKGRTPVIIDLGYTDNTAALYRR